MYPADLPTPKSYSQEEVQEILYLAISRQVDKGEITREQLLEIAEELAIESQDLEAAEREWKESRLVNVKRREFDLYRQERLKERTTRYLIVNGFLVAINLISAGTISWVIYPALVMAIPLSLSAWKTYQREGQTYERDFQRWKIQQEVKDSFTTLWTRIKNFLQL